MNLSEALSKHSFSLFFGKAKTRCEALTRYRALQLFTKASWCKTDLNQYLNDFAKSSLGTREKKEFQQNFCLRISTKEHGDPLLYHGLYRDTRYTLALFKYNESSEANEYEYLACMGFDVLGDNIIVQQIQGNHGKEKFLCLFKWERMLLAILTDWAKQNGFSQIRVIQAKDTEWYRNEDRKKRMFMHYDVTARRSGFRFDQTSGQYVKVLA